MLLSVGEASADAHAARVVRALRAAAPSVEIDAVCGAATAEAGVNPIASIERLSATGLVEAARSLPAHVRLRRDLARRLATGGYDLALLVDYPGFHLSVARVAARADVPVLYYIAPQLWAWGAWRLASLQSHVRALAVVLPFEQPYFRDRGVPATFVGHPLLDAAPPESRDAARHRLGIGGPAPVLGLFPGSRPQEIERLWPVFRDAARHLVRRMPGLRVVVAGTDTGQYPDAAGFVVWRGPAPPVYAAADAGLCKSGTTTLEAALHGMPMVIAYRMHPVTYAVARRAVGVRRVGLVNLVMDRDVAPEILQRAAKPDTLAGAVEPLLDRDSPPAVRQRDAFLELRARLGEPGAAARVAEMALAMVA